MNTSAFYIEVTNYLQQHTERHDHRVHQSKEATSGNIYKVKALN